MAITDRYVTDYPELTASNINGTEQMLGFDAVEGRRTKLSELAKYFLQHYQLATTKGTKSVKELIDSSVVPSSIADFPDADNYATKTYVDQNAGRINEIKVNGNIVTPVNKVVNITTPTKITDLADAGDYATKTYVAQNGGKIDKIQVNGTDQTISGKTVNIAVPTKVSDLSDKNNYYTKSDVDGKGYMNFNAVQGFLEETLGRAIQSATCQQNGLFSVKAPIVSGDNLIAGMIVTNFPSWSMPKLLFFDYDNSVGHGRIFDTNGLVVGGVASSMLFTGDYLDFNLSSESESPFYAKVFLLNTWQGIF